MTVLCPCGSSCPGADNVGRAPECFQSFSSDRLPGRYSGTTDEPLLGRILLAGVTVLAISSGVKIRYEGYECPSCGHVVVFSITKGSKGFRRQRIVNNAICA